MDTNDGVLHSTLALTFRSSLRHLPNAAVCSITPFIACAQSSSATITSVAGAGAGEENLVGNKMDAPKTIAHEIGGIQNDALRFGLHGVKSDIVGSHPLESAYQSAKSTQEEMKRKILMNTYGSAFPLKLDLDKQILSRFQRPPGAIPSSMLGLEALTGSLDEFGFEDYLNDPRDSETFRPLDMHHGMEVRLGVSKGPICPSFI